MASSSPTIISTISNEPTDSNSNSNLEPQKDAAKPRPFRPRRPNYKYLHRFPLPLHVHPLPPLIPHNPLSLISIALSYLTYFISPPHQHIYPAYFDLATSSVHVTDAKAIRALWEMGFFGKGSLSRSEPSWLDREKNRRGLTGDATSEEVTGKRRVERRERKLERARKEKEAIVEQLKAEAQSRYSGGDFQSPDLEKALSTLETPVNGAAVVRPDEQPQEDKNPIVTATDSFAPKHDIANGNVESELSNGIKTVRFSPVVEQKEYNVAEGALSHLPEPSISPTHEPEHYPVLKNEEHLQLSNEEAFFLVYGLGVLQVYNSHRTSVLSAASLLPLLRQHSYFPPREPATLAEPDDPFMLSYVVYHHFRSLGWVIRSGVKFGVDYLLYNRGPVFSHAEFAVCLLPAYSDPYWTATVERRQRVAKKESRTWWWLHCVNRVQAQVKKSLVLCYVEVPPPSPHGQLTDADGERGELDIGALLKTYKVREMSIKRWVPNRSRD
ncbi:tRNA-intron endonuclease [Emergomyces pasteurianus Ep9510]|uniref:tRNA-splicing endonuclease subunit Sen2 n=1 Tax=Emergomyces pasteurianus Ep9510 TaxID=1447872 RepID=A0A1J9QG82_9EURO|nr:tRNA-intron endonuclease [Emergomyces pasteurianus Ep9510]